jgi:hypothetical protein
MRARLWLSVPSLALGVFAQDAFAVTPRIVGRPAIAHTSFSGTRNTLMYDVAVTVDGTGADADHAAVVGYVPDDDFTTCADESVPWKWARSQVFDVTDTRTWTLYNFVPGTAYRYKVMVGDPSGVVRAQCGMLRTPTSPTPRLPADLANLNLQFAKSGAAYETKYVILETTDCGAGTPGGAGYYVVAVDTEHEAIVWYLDIAAVTGRANATGSGLRYQEGPTANEDRILITVGQRYLYEWGFDGSENNFWDFAPSDECNGTSGSTGPCVHHDVFKSDATGNTYALASRLSPVDAMGTAWEDACGTDSRFLDDGFRVLDSSWSVVGEHYLIGDYDYDPTVDGGPADEAVASRGGACDSSHWRNSFDPSWGVMEWTHANGIAASRFGTREVIDFSLREWDQVIRIDAETGARLWSLSANEAYSDWGTFQKASGIVGRAEFQGQHAVHAVGPNTLMMFDNRGAGAMSRVLEIELTRDPLAATIQKSWAIVDELGDPLLCPTEGTAEGVPNSDHVLALCSTRHAFVELDDPTGNTGTPPPLFVSLPTDDTFCLEGGPSSARDIHGWHKAFSAARLGQF